MSQPRILRCHRSIDRAYEPVRNLLRRQPLALLQRATTSAAAHAGSLAATLRVGAGGLEIGVDVRPFVQRIVEEESVAGLAPVTRLEIGWEATRSPALFPSMSLELSAWPLSAGSTELRARGEYRPPLGPIGNALDAAIGHEIAEASVQRFVDDVVEEIRRELPADV